MDPHTQVPTAKESAISILLIGPLDTRRCALRSILSPPKWETWEASTYGEAAGILDNHRIGVAICDTEVGDWQALLSSLQGRANPPHVIVYSRLADERFWAEVLSLGGYDVLVQPFDRGEVLRVAHMAWTAWGQEDRGPAQETCGNLRAHVFSA
jgi:DNA-binding response OmpR family regulator